MKSLSVAIGSLLTMAACFAVLHGCSETPAAVIGADASDGGTSPDAAKPRVDATTADAGYDGGILRGEWREIPGLPSSGCLYAVEPAKSIDPLTWEACPGRAGCEQVKVTWTPFRDALWPATDVPVSVIGGKAYFMGTRNYPSEEGKSSNDYIHEAEDLQGNVVFAVSSTIDAPSFANTCMLGDPSIGISSFAVTGSLPSERQLLRTVWQPIGQTSQTTSIAIGVSDVVYPLSGPILAGDQARIIGTSQLPDGGGGTIYMADMLTKRIVSSKNNYPNMGSPRAVVGGAIVYTNGGIGFLSNDNELTKIYQPAAGSFIWTITVDRTDNDRIVWVEYVSGDNSIIPSYWTAPLVKTANSIVPRRITAFKDELDARGDGMTVSNGIIVNKSSLERVLVTRVSDGWSWEIPTSPGETTYRGVWADADYIWTSRNVFEPYPGGGGGGVIRSLGMYRFSRATLGAPTIPPS